MREREEPKLTQDASLDVLKGDGDSLNRNGKVWKGTIKEPRNKTPWVGLVFFVNISGLRQVLSCPIPPSSHLQHWKKFQDGERNWKEMNCV